MLINLVGGDGCGKTTQIDLLKPWIEEELGRPVRELTKSGVLDVERFPESRLFGCPYEEMAREIVPQMQGESRALFLFFMQAAAIGRYPPLGDEVVLTSGYWHKIYATEAALGVDAAWLRQVGSMFPVPDLSVLLDVEPERVVPRGLDYKPYECGCVAVCTDAAFVAHQRKVLAWLREMARCEGWAVVDAGDSKTAVCEALKALLGGPLASPAGRGPAAAGARRAPAAAAPADEFDMLMARSGISVPPDRRAGAAGGYEELKRMTALLRQARTAASEPAHTFSLREIVRGG
jgi:thymidylate kinase